MEVMLKVDVPHVGHAGDIVRIKNGFARNYLFPKGLAQRVTSRRVQEFAHLKQVALVKKKKALLLRQSEAEKIAALELTLRMRAGVAGKLFGSVTTGDIAQSLVEKGFKVERKSIHLDAPIKTLGEHEVMVRLGDGVESTLRVMVEAEEESQMSVTSQQVASDVSVTAEEVAQVEVVSDEGVLVGGADDVEEDDSLEWETEESEEAAGDGGDTNVKEGSSA